MSFTGVTKLWTWTVQNGLLKYGLPSKTMDFTRWLPVEVHILEFVPMAILNYGLRLKTMDSES
jgi:hypothetical protein